MIKKFVIIIKYLSFVTLILIGVLSCEKDFRNVGVNIVDNNIFSTEKYTSEVIAYSQDIERNQANGLDSYLLGTQRDAVFGKLEASLVTQLSLINKNPDYGTNAVIDTVIVDIPYFSTLDGTQTDPDDNEVPNFVLDSVWTSGAGNFQLNIYELGTYLNSVNPDDPTELNTYYSDESFIKKNPSTPLFSGLISTNPNDTMLVVKRYKYPDFPDLSNKELYKTDSLKYTVVAPSLKIPLDKDIIKTIFQDHSTSADFASNSNFQHYFRGLYLEALENNPYDAALMNFDMEKAVMTIYYSNDVTGDEGEDVDLNGNGITGEENVTYRSPNSFVYTCKKGVKSNLYLRDYTASDFENNMASIDPINGEEQLFVQGAAGSIAVVRLFGEDANSNGVPDELEMLRTKEWLINDAKLTFYIDKDNTTNWTTNRLYLYNIDREDDDDDYDTQFLDAMTSIKYLDGALRRDENGNPEKFVFHIADFISKIIKPDSDIILHDIGIKVFDTKDLPESQYATDTIVDSFNSNPKGLVLKGNLPISDQNRIKLEIFYSEKN